MKFKNYIFLTILLCISIFENSLAQTAPDLGGAQSFAVLGSATVTNTGPTLITGNVGVSPGSAVTGFPPAIINSGQIYSGATSLAGAAQIGANAAYLNIKSQTSPSENNLTGKVLGETAGAVTLTPGVYTFTSSAQLNATLTLNDGGDPNAVFIFKIGSTLTTASYSKVVMSSGGTGPNVYWQIGSSATIGTYTTFVGNIIALASITMTTGATTTGRLLALNGAVTMDTNTAYAVAVQLIADSDDDGVADNLDDYPNDPKKAFNNYSSTLGSTVAFDDQWPLKGDFDLNDMVITYKYNIITNAQNIVVQVIGYFNLVASGGNSGSAFGVEFPIAREKADALTGGILETGQSKAVVILFTNMRSETTSWNTLNGAAHTAPLIYTVNFNVLNGPTLNSFGTDFNPFIYNMSGSSRLEVHLPGKTPTDLADKTLFGNADDNTNVAANRYYVTKTGLPYAINIPTAFFDYPVEQTDITLAYLHFADWAQSGGTLFPDWFSNIAPGYRNRSLFYVK